jgi:microsomal epoxide hydrolase
MRAAELAMAGAVAVAALAACGAVADGDDGVGSGSDMDDTALAADEIRPFTIAVPDSVLEDLRARLSRARLPDQIPGTAWAYGTDRGYLEALLAYWRDDFDWRAQERRLNAFDHFRTAIDGVDVHFIHQRSERPDAVPLLMIHGWPGSFVEFAGVVGPLTEPTGHGAPSSDAFHVVAPSLPGFGFSGKPTERGYGPERMADVLAALMERLGYDRYGVQGGDWGGIIGRSLAGNYPEHVIGLHSNFILGGPAPGADPNEGVTPEELELRRERVEAFAEGSAYQEIQGTKPQTLGYGLNDSPAGLAAWIVEKFHGWSDHAGDVEEAFTRDELLTNVTLYWVTETITSSTRIYYESRHAPTTRPVQYVEVPTAGAIFPREIYFTPRAWAEARYNIVRWTVMPRGGHFAALEEPELLVDDIRAFYRELR